MRYLKWKKETKKMYEELRGQLGIEDLTLRVPKITPKDTISINLARMQLTLSFSGIVKFAKKTKKETKQNFSLLEVTEVAMMHELGHYMHYKKNWMQFINNQRTRRSVLNKIKRSNENKLFMDTKEKIHLIKVLRTVTMANERKAWEYASLYFEGNMDTFKLIKKQALTSYWFSYNKNIASLRMSLKESVS